MHVTWSNLIKTRAPANSSWSMDSFLSAIVQSRPRSKYLKKYQLNQIDLQSLPVSLSDPEGDSTLVTWSTCQSKT